MQRISFLSSILLLAVVSLAATFSVLAQSQQNSPKSLADTSWPMYQHDQRHTGLSPHLGITSSPQIAWKKELAPDGAGESSTGMSIDRDGTVYVATTGKLFALNPQDGTIKWDMLVGHSRSTPAVANDGTIYWGYRDSFVAITTTGEVAWGWSGLSGNAVFGSSPVISDDGTIFVTHDDMFSFSSEGSIQWVYYYSTWFHHTSPTIGPDGTIYTGYGAFTPDGSLKFFWPVENRYTKESPSIGTDGTLYLVTQPAKLYAIHPDGTIKWFFESDEVIYDYSNVPGAPAIGPDGTIYFGVYPTMSDANVSHIYAINPDGSLKWKYPIYSNGTFYPGVTASMVVDKLNNSYACACNGSCYGFAPDGTLLWEFVAVPHDTRNRTAPLIVSDGIMLILDGTGTLYCLASPDLPRLNIDPQSLFVDVDYGTPVVTRTLAITSTSSPITWTATISPSVSWISTSVTSGTTPTDLQITLMTSELVRGSYSIDLQFVSDPPNNIVNQPFTVPIHLDVGIQKVYLPTVKKPW